MRRWLNFDVSIRAKLLCSYLLLSIIPLLLLGVFQYNFYLEDYIRQGSDFSMQLANQITRSIKTYFSDIDAFSVDIAYNQMINDALDEQRFDPDYQNDIYTEAINDQLYLYMTSRPGINSIHVYGTKEDYHAYKSGTINRYYNAQVQDYIQRASQNYGRSYIVSRNEGQFYEKFYTTSIVRPIRSLYSYNVLGTLVINIDNSVFDSLIIDQVQVDSAYKIYIIDENGLVQYSSNKEEAGKSFENDLLYTQEIQKGRTTVVDAAGQRYLFSSTRSDIMNQTAVVLMPYSYLLKGINESTGIIIVIALGLALLAMLFALLLSHSITKPLQQLRSMFSHVGEPDYAMLHRVDGKNEVSVLWNGFYNMDARIKELLNETIDKENEKRIAEINALQMNINPHFLYNTLNSIRYLAIVQNAGNINHITNLLISLLKDIAKNKSRFVTVGQELGMVDNYMEIQKTVYMDKFDVSVVCPLELRDAVIIKFILQPIVENSIFHGMLPIERKGHIRIRIQRSDDNLLISVIDNGLGFKVPKDYNALEGDRSKNNHIGLRNIHQRLRLFYGEDYGLRIWSKYDLGTIVTLTLPYRTELEDEPC